MTPDVLVLDASVVLDGAAPGPRFDALSALHERFACRAPALLAWEIGHVVHGRRAALFAATPQKRAALVEAMLEGIELVPTDAAARAATARLAARHGLTFYDASYLELAAREPEGTLATHDAALRRAAQRELAGRALGLDD
ncbi:MAG: hypothetical protein QOE90_1216 [Thermoplasmata archaeon]|jgi:predicted nucleic acid-binding protein|nr:hypothetical protein [Thermoplasmata archaeon]